MAKFQNRAGNTFQNAYLGWLDSVSINLPDAGFVPLPVDRVWSIIRQERDNLLAACDWTQTMDAPLTDGQRSMWKIYRQVLRDLPEAYSTPADVMWPEQPAFSILDGSMVDETGR